MPRTSLNQIQTQALVSLLCTIGQYASIDLREDTGGAIRLTYYSPAYSEPIVYRIAADGETHEINGWAIYHDGATWWAKRGDDDEMRACSSWLEASRYAAANP